jgi:hypothetical protein
VQSQVDEVKGEAQLTIACCQTRIGQELVGIPKATGPHRPGDKKIAPGRNSKPGKGRR